MSVRFIIGRAGSGKTRHCLEAISRHLRDAPLGPAVLWLLPRSATFQAERQLACETGLKGFFRCRVLSIESFVQTIMDECGGADWATITPLGRRIILGHLLRREAPQLSYFQASAAREGMIRRLDATFSEIDRTGAIGALAEADFDGEDAAFTSKLSDLRHLYDAYNAYVGQEQLDPQRRMNDLLEQIGECPLLQGASIYVDAFTHFSSTECRILAAAANAAERMELTLVLDADHPVLANPHHRIDEFSLFHRTAEAYQQLWLTFSQAQVSIQDPLRLTTTHRFAASPLLSQVERIMAGGRLENAKPPAAHDAADAAIQFIEAPDAPSEVDAAARQIQDWLHQGLRLRQIAVLSRDLSSYEQVIPAAFEEHGIPFFLDNRRGARHHPLLQFLGEVLRVARDNWPQDAVICLLKSGLTPISPAESDEVENYVLRHRIRGAGWSSPKPWQFISESRSTQDEPAQPKQEEKDLAAKMDALRRKALDPLTPFVTAMRAGAQTVAQMTGQMRQLLRRLAIEQRLGQWIHDATVRGELELAAEHQRIWDETQSLLQQMEQLLGGEILSLDDFASLFQIALEEFDLALTPPTLDQVLVGQLDRTVTPDVRAVIVLGMNDGTFPAIPQEDSILNDADRRVLRQRHFHVEADTRRQLLDERFVGYVALTRASQWVCLSRPRGQADGKAIPPSIFWQELRAHFPQAPLRTLVPEAHPSPDMIGTPRQLIGGLMRWVRDDANGGTEAAHRSWLASLYQWLVAASDRGPIDHLRTRAWGALSYDNIAKLPASTARLLFTPEQASSTDPTGVLRATAAQLESFAACPFQHFARYGLQLETRRGNEEVTLGDLSHLYHRILRQIVAHLLRQRQDWAQLQPHASRELIAQLAREAGIALKDEWMLSTGRNQYLLGRIARTIEQVVARQRAATPRGRFATAFADVGFGQGSPIPPVKLTTPNGNSLQLRGSIDRLDLLDSGGAAVTDYELTGRKIVLGEVIHGLSLKLLISLLALRAGGERLGRGPLTPAAAFYMRLFRKLDHIDHPDDAGDPDDPDFDLKVKPRGLIDAEYLPDLDQALTNGDSQVVSAFLKQDGICGNLSKTDTATHQQMAALLDRVQELVCQMADRVLAGDINIQPYRLGDVTPCPRCPYKSICRFDPAADSYRHLSIIKRTDVLQQLEGGQPADKSAKGKV